MAVPTFIIDQYYIVFTFLFTFVWQHLFFFFAAYFKMDKVTDFAYGTNFIALAVVTLILGNNYTERQIIVTIIVCVWGLRLAGYLLTRILAIGHDKRFDEMRDNCLSFWGFWIFQTVTVWVVFLPQSGIMGVSYNPALNGVDYFGIAFSAVGLLLETVADQQKFSFRNNPDNKKKWCDVGVWKYSRHPNFWGEWMVWWGLFSICSSVYTIDAGMWAFAIGPAYLTIVMLTISGVPKLEKSADKRYWDQEEYQQYRKQTSILIPLPTSLYGALPMGFKRVFCLEWPMFENPDAQQANQKTPIKEDVENQNSSN